jgi:hypothetical protein
MDEIKPFFIIFLMLTAGTLACSMPGIIQQAQTVGQTAQGLRTEVSGIVTSGGSLLKTAQALGTQVPGVFETVKAIGTQGAPLLSTIQAVSTYNPVFVQTVQAFINNEIPTGEQPSDIPIINRELASNFFGSSQYIFYISPVKYDQVLIFYKTEMPGNGWQYLQSDSHEFVHAAQLDYFKDNRTAIIDLSLNPLNNTTVVVINIMSHK